MAVPATLQGELQHLLIKRVLFCAYLVDLYFALNKFQSHSPRILHCNTCTKMIIYNFTGKVDSI
jgi:hypothetical protein